MNKIILTNQEYKIYQVLKDHPDTALSIAIICDEAGLSNPQGVRSKLVELVKKGICVKREKKGKVRTNYQLKEGLDNVKIVSNDRRFTASGKTSYRTKP